MSFGCKGDDDGHQDDGHGTDSSDPTGDSTDPTSGPGTNPTDPTDPTVGETDDGTDTSSTEDRGSAWYFGTDPEANAWIVTIVDASDPAIVEQIEVEDLALLSGPDGNDAGPGWGDAIVSSDGARVFVNATNIDRVAVFEVATRSLEAVLDGGGRPVHIYSPNHGTEIWTHADAEGAFHVFDQTSLASTGPIVAALEATGHGKLLYSGALGTKYYATNTNDPGAFVLDGDAKSDGTYLQLCAQPCEDDPETPEDESEDLCGGTHDKAFNPTMNWAIFQCSGATGDHYAFVDAATDAVVHDLVPMAGGVANTPGYEYTLLLHADMGVQIWDTQADGHDGLEFDAVVAVADRPSDRGTEFRQLGDGAWEAWVPQNEGRHVVVINLATRETEEIDIGTVTVPDGVGHFARRSAIGGGWFFNFNGDGAVLVDVETHGVVQGPSIPFTSRIAFVDAHD